MRTVICSKCNQEKTYYAKGKCLKCYASEYQKNRVARIRKADKALEPKEEVKEETATA